jgi:hypothetical protein
MIYLWEKPEYCPQRIIAEYNRELSVDRFLFRRGAKLAPEQADGKIIFEIEITKAEISKYDCIPNNSASPLVNQKIVDILLKLTPDDVQFFDTEAQCKDGVLTNYQLLNITHTITGIDHKKSVYSILKDTGGISNINYLTYKPGCMGNHKLARDEEYKGNLLVTEEVKQVFKKEKITGIWFATPEEWYALA